MEENYLNYFVKFLFYIVFRITDSIDYWESVTNLYRMCTWNEASTWDK